jgi:cytochrome c heme-lyase
MFWNALVRKNKADGVEEGEINMVIAIHNEMNERTWRMLLDWEKSLHASELTNGQPSLRKFMGKPYDPSPKATLKSWFGYGHPFDRHDWYVDRGDKLVRYIIDYYYSTDDTLNVANVANGAEPAKYTKAIYVDVRPAVDDFTSFVDRIRRFPERFFGIFSRPYFKGEGIDPSKRPNEAAALATLHSSNTLSDSTNPASAAAGAADAPQHPDFAKIDSKCSKLLANLKAAKTDEERRSAHLSLTYCMSNIICPNEAASFMTTLDKNASAGRAGASGGDEERAFESMSKCVVDTLAKMREYEPPSTLR